MNDKLYDFMNEIKEEIVYNFENRINDVLNIFKSSEIFIKRYDKNFYSEIVSLCESANKPKEQFFKIYFNSQIDNLNEYLETNLKVESRPKIDVYEGNIYFYLSFNDKNLMEIDLKNRLLIDKLKFLKDTEINNININIKELEKEKTKLNKIIENPTFENLKKEFNMKDILLKKDYCLNMIEERNNFIELKLYQLKNDIILLTNKLSEEEYKYLEIKEKLYKLGFGF